MPWVEDQPLPVNFPTGQTRAPEPVAPPAPDTSFGSVMGAAFRQSNEIASAAANIPLRVENYRAEGYKPWDDIAGTKYEDHWERFAESLNPEFSNALKRQIDMEEEDRNTLAAAGWGGFFAEMGASVLSPTILIPGAGLIGKAGQGYKIGRTMLAGAATAGGAIAVQEALLQSTQETRTWQESAINIGGGAVLGALLGGGAAALLSRAEKKVALEAFDRAVGLDTKATAANLSAATRDQLSREDLDVSGAAASAVVKATSPLNPNLRTFSRASARGREYLMSIYDNTIGVKANERGIAVAPGGAAEIDARRLVNSRLSAFKEEADMIYAEMRKAGTTMSKADFFEAVGFAARRDDVAIDGNAYVTRAAKTLRSKILEPFKQDAINAKLFDPDAEVNTAQSYLARVWNREKVIAREPELAERLARHYGGDDGVVAKEFFAAKEKSAAAVARLREQIADLRTAPEERLRVLQDLEQQGEALDLANAESIEIYSRIVDQQRAAREARESGNRAAERAAQEQIKRLREEGGAPLQRYLEQRRDLRRRRRNVDKGIAGAEMRVEALRQKLVDIEEANFRALATLVRRGQVFERLDQRWDPAKIEEALDGLTEKFDDTVRKADAADLKARMALEAMQQRVMQKTQKLRAQEIEFKAKAKEAKKSDPMAKPALDQKAYEAQQKRLELEIEADQKQAVVLERIANTQRRYAEQVASLQARIDAVSALDPEARIAEARAVTEEIIRKRSDTALARGERAAEIMERMKMADPAKVEERIAALQARAAKLEDDFRTKWERRIDDVDAPDFNMLARDIATQAIDKLSGRARAADDDLIGQFMTPIERGPLKERTLNVPDELIEDFLVNNAEEVANQYSRTVGGSIAIKKILQRHGFSTTRDMKQSIIDDYKGLIEQVTAAPTAKEAMAVVGREPGMLDNFRAWAGKEDVAVTKEKLLSWLKDDMDGTLEDLDAGLQMISGVYKLQENNTGFGTLVQRANTFNYIRLSGNFGLSSITEVYNAAFAHGVGPFLREGVMPLLKRLDGLKLQKTENRLAGLVAERTLNNRLYMLGEIGDPFARGTLVDKVLRGGATLATKWNGVALMQDISENIAGRLTQNRIFKALEKGTDDEFLAKLNLGSAERSRIAEQWKAHGRVEDGVLYIANTERWTDDYARDAFQNALQKATGMYVVRPGAGDLPLFARTPLGKALLQFRSFALAGHQRTTLRAMQEGPGAMVRGIVGTTVAGMFVSWLAALRSGEEGYERWRRQAENPGWWIAEGFDRGGFVPLLFEASNTIEKMSGTLFGNTFNPIKTTAGMPFGGAAYGGESSRNVNRSLMSSLLGPTFGLIDTVPRALGGTVGLMQGEDPSSSQQRAALSLVPFGSMPVAKEVLQMLTGDSPYMQ